MSSFGFDTNNTSLARPSFSPLKPGWYQARIVGAELIDSTKPGVGQMLKLTFEVIAEAQGQQCIGRKLFSYLCHHHEKQQTREIAQGNIVSILQALDKVGATTVDVMLGGELQIKLTTREASGDYDASNDVKGFRALGATDGSPAPAAAGKAVAAATKPTPWGKKG